MKKIFIFAILFFSFNIHSAFSENEDILINQMRTGSGIEKLEAITKLGEIDNIHTSNALIIELLLDKNSFAIKKYISDTLAKTKNPETIYALIRFLDNENYTIKMYITEILEKIGQPAIKPLLDTITPDNSSRLKAYAVYILKTIQNSNAIDLLVKNLSNENKNIRMDSAYVLGEIGTNKAHEALKKALAKEKDKDITACIKKALKKNK